MGTLCRQLAFSGDTKLALLRSLIMQRNCTIVDWSKSYVMASLNLAFQRDVWQAYVKRLSDLIDGSEARIPKEQVARFER